jgi:hypothetical protein
MINLLNISLFTACKNKKIFDFILKPNIMRDAVRVNIEKYKEIFLNQIKHITKFHINCKYLCLIPSGFCLLGIPNINPYSVGYIEYF